MFDAGVPLLSPAAGVAIGLVTGEDTAKDYKVLTDLLGIEDYAGDMDFKIAGTKNGYTALQLDVKILGLTRQQLTESLIRGREGVDYVLEKMAVMRDRPRAEFKSSVPVIETVPIEIYKRHTLFRGGAMNVKLIEAETGAKITMEDDAHISVFAPNKEMMEEAKAMLKKILTDSEEVSYNFGQIIEVEVAEMVEKGVYVHLRGASQPVFVPNSQIHPTPISHSSATGLKTGQKLTMQWLNRDPVTGKIRLSRRMLTSTIGKAIRK
ncbi:unnamed protein product [Auanema sp. JU1783]|nr:unnamed protein product [Auanema sp. JU1783]